MKYVVAAIIGVVLVLTILCVGAWVIVDRIIPDNDPVPTQVAGNNNTGNGGAVVNPLPNVTYYPELSCSHLPSCQVTEVPDGFISVTFTNLANGGCDWKLLQSGEDITFEGIDEFHTYHGDLPYTAVDGFVNSQKMYIHACQP